MERSIGNGDDALIGSVLAEGEPVQSGAAAQYSVKIELVDEKDQLSGVEELLP